MIYLSVRYYGNCGYFAALEVPVFCLFKTKRDSLNFEETKVNLCLSIPASDKKRPLAVLFIHPRSSTDFYYALRLD